MIMSYIMMLLGYRAVDTSRTSSHPRSEDEGRVPVSRAIVIAGQLRRTTTACLADLVDRQSCIFRSESLLNLVETAQSS